MTPVRLATRGSPLALSQARLVADQIRSIIAPRTVELLIVQTQGDRDSSSLSQIGGLGVFTKEVQQAVLNRRADVAIHSLKDLPTQAVTGLTLAAVPRRAPVNDVLIAPKLSRLDDLPNGAIVATGSLRRQAILRHRRPDLVLADIRGNVDSRIQRVKAGEFDAIVLAQAGLDRLGRHSEITEPFDPAWMLPAPGQGALGLECRSNDQEMIAVLAQANDPDAMASVTAERSLLHHLGGGCQMPLGAWAAVTCGELHLIGTVLAKDGSERIDADCRGEAATAELLGQQLAERMLEQGARRLLGM